MDVEAAHRGATHPDVIPEQHPSRTASVLGGTTRRAQQHVEIRRAVHAARARGPGKPAAADRLAATGCRHDASRHLGVPRRSAPPR